MTKTRRSTGERRLEIIQATLCILHKQGVGQLTMRQLAADVDLSEAAIYRHFSNKEDIMEQVAAHVFRGPRAEETSPKRPAKERLREVMFGQLEALEENPHTTAVVFQEDIFREYPRVEGIFSAHRDAMVRRISSIVRQGQQEGFVRRAANPQVFAVIFIGTIRQLAAEWRANDFKDSLKERALPVFEELMRLLDIP